MPRPSWRRSEQRLPSSTSGLREIRPPCGGCLHGPSWDQLCRPSSQSVPNDGLPACLCRELSLGELEGLQAQLEAAAAAAREATVQRCIATAAAEAAARESACGVCWQRRLDTRLACGHLFCQECVEGVVAAAVAGGREPCCPSCRRVVGGTRDGEGRLGQRVYLTGGSA